MYNTAYPQIVYDGEGWESYQHLGQMIGRLAAEGPALASHYALYQRALRTPKHAIPTGLARLNGLPASAAAAVPANSVPRIMMNGPEWAWGLGLVAALSLEDLEAVCSWCRERGKGTYVKKV
jgi:hypothetical protein